MLQLKKIEDPRDGYAKLRRKECEILAKQHGVDCEPGVPAMVMQRRLRAAHIPIPQFVAGRVLGAPVNNPPPPDVEAGHETGTDPVDLLEKSWKQDSLEVMSIAALRGMARSKGLTLTRTDKKTDIIAKIRGSGG